MQQDVIERIVTLLRSGDRYLEILANAILSDVLVEPLRAEPDLILRILIRASGGDESIIRHFASSRSACFSVRSKPLSGTSLIAEATAFSASGR